MIYMIQGRTGSGKTYEAVVFHILEAVKEGRKVITNIPLNLDHFVKIFGKDVLDLILIKETKYDDFGNMDRVFSKPEHYKDEWRDDNGRAPLVVVDEAHMVLSKANAKVEVLEFYSMHRHEGYDITLITQNARKIHQDIRDLTELLYIVSKNTAAGSTKSYTRKVKSGCQGEIVNSGIRTYKDSYFPFYNSHTGSSGAVTEAGAKDVKAFWKHPIFYLIPVVLSGVLYGFWNFYALYTAEDEPQQISEVKRDAESTGSTQAADVATPVKVPLPVNEAPLAAYTLRVEGYIIQSFAMFEKTQEVTFSVWGQHGKQFNVSDEELRGMGYEVIQLSECVYNVVYTGYIETATCYEVQNENLNTPDEMLAYQEESE